MKTALAAICFCFLFSLANECAPGKSANSEPGALPAPTAAPKTVSEKTPPSDDAYWQGASGKFAVKWTKDDITAENENGAKVFSVRRFVQERLKNSAENFSKNGEPNFEKFTFEYKILSIVGSFLFLRESTSYSPQTYTRESFTAVDLANPSAEVALTKFYSEAEIIDALDKNPLVVEDFNLNKIAPPRDFRAFFTAYDREPREVAERQIDRCYFPKTVFKSFYFDRLENDKVIVNLGIPCRVGMREETVYPLELILPMKASIENDLRAADAQNLLQEKYKSSETNAETVVAFDAKSLKKSK